MISGVGRSRCNKNGSSHAAFIGSFPWFTTRSVGFSFQLDSDCMNQGDVSSVSCGLMWAQLSQRGPLFADTMASTLCPARSIILSKVSTWGLFFAWRRENPFHHRVCWKCQWDVLEKEWPQCSLQPVMAGGAGWGMAGWEIHSPAASSPCWDDAAVSPHWLQGFPNWVAEAHSGSWCDYTSFSRFLSVPASPPHFPSSISSDHLLNKERGLESLPQGLFLGELKSIQAIVYFFLLPALLTSTCPVSVGVKKS